MIYEVTFQELKFIIFIGLNNYFAKSIFLANMSHARIKTRNEHPSHTI